MPQGRAPRNWFAGAAGVNFTFFLHFFPKTKAKLQRRGIRSLGGKFMQRKDISPMDGPVVKSIYGEQKNIGNTERLLKTILDIPSEDYGGLTVVKPLFKRR
jgi:hypothetical protein